jgi:hypothetical protein
MRHNRTACATVLETQSISSYQALQLQRPVRPVLLHAGVAEVKLNELLTRASAETLTLVAEMMDPINRESLNITNADHFILTEQAQVLLIELLLSQRAGRRSHHDGEPQRAIPNSYHQQKGSANSMNAANRQTLQSDAHNHTRDDLAHALATTGTLLVKTEVKAPETQSINSSGLRTSHSQRTDITGKKYGDTVHTDISLCQYAASGVIKAPAQKAQDYFKSIRDARAACASTAFDPVQKSISRSGNKKANEKIRKYRPGIQTKNNHKNATGYTSFCPTISSSNATLHPSSLDFIKAVVATDTTTLSSVTTPSIS